MRAHRDTPPHRVVSARKPLVRSDGRFLVYRPIVCRKPIGADGPCKIVCKLSRSSLRYDGGWLPSSASKFSLGSFGGTSRCDRDLYFRTIFQTVFVNSPTSSVRHCRWSQGARPRAIETRNTATCRECEGRPIHLDVDETNKCGDHRKRVAFLSKPMGSTGNSYFGDSELIFWLGGTRL